MLGTGQAQPVGKGAFGLVGGPRRGLDRTG